MGAGRKRARAVPRIRGEEVFLRAMNVCRSCRFINDIGLGYPHGEVIKMAVNPERVRVARRS